MIPLSRLERIMIALIVVLFIIASYRQTYLAGQGKARLKVPYSSNPR